MVANPSNNPACKSTLVIAPVALIKQWEQEIKRRVKPQYQLSVYVHHSTSRKAFAFEDMQKYDVVITTYGVITREHREHFGLNRKNDETSDDIWANHGNGGSSEEIRASEKSKDRTGTSPFYGKDKIWYRIVLDEAQYIKNKETRAAVACSALDAKFRWCLSGTPMQNKIEELYSLVRFLRIEPYQDERKFNRDIGRGIKRNHEASMKKLQALLKAILLRRTKSSKIDGRPILSLPPKIIEAEEEVFGEDERNFYQQIETGAINQMNKYLSENSVAKHYSSILVSLLRLRQACCHPKLIEKSQNIKAQSELKANAKKSVDLSRGLNDQVIRRLKEEEGFICPICVDAIEKKDVMISVPCGHFMCNECSNEFFSKIKVSEVSDEPENSTAKCCTCQGPVSQSKSIPYPVFELMHVHNMNDANVLKEIKAHGVTKDKRKKSKQNIKPVKFENDDIFKDFFSKIEGQSEDEETQDEETQDEEEAQNEPFKFNEDKKLFKDEDEQHKNNLLTPGSPNTSDYWILNSETKSLFPDGWVSSAKIDKCVELLHKVKNEFPGEKVIVFSQFTSLLDLLEVPLDNQDVNYLRYDGSMTANERNKTVLDFFDRPEILVMLASLKAGNVGLTLTCASHVIIMDPFWNPYVEEQAMDRAHRIGQMRPVYVHKLVIKDTVEDRILALQKKKKELIDAALSEKSLMSIGKLNQEELLFLFGFNSKR